MTGLIACFGTTTSTRVFSPSSFSWRRLSSTTTSIRCQSSGPSSAGIAAQSSGFWNQLVPSSRLRSRWSPDRWLTTTGCDVERHDEVGVLHLVDVPRVRRGDERQLGPRRGLRLGLRRAHHHVLDAEVLQVLHTDLGVVVDVAQRPHRVGRLLRHRRRRQEVIRRGARRLEEEPLHRADAAVGPERQQHQRHRRAVVAVLAAVLPRRPAAAERRIVTDPLHRLHDVVVLGVVRAAALVPHEVVARPPVADRLGVGVGGGERPPRVHGLVVVGLHLELAARQHLVHPAEHDQHDRGRTPRRTWRPPRRWAAPAPTGRGSGSTPVRAARPRRPSSSGSARDRGTAAGAGSTAAR